MVCYRCGQLGHADESYRFSKGDFFSDSGECSLIPENFVSTAGEVGSEVPVPMMVEGKGGDGGVD